MPAQWTGEIVVQLHLNHISKKQLAEEAGVTPEYLSMVLNGRREPAGAREKFQAALNRILQRKHSEVRTE